jgi:hypothetical protein
MRQKTWGVTVDKVTFPRGEGPDQAGGVECNTANESLLPERVGPRPRLSEQEVSDAPLTDKW